MVGAAQCLSVNHDKLRVGAANWTPPCLRGNEKAAQHCSAELDNVQPSKIEAPDVAGQIASGRCIGGTSCDDEREELVEQCTSEYHPPPVLVLSPEAKEGVRNAIVFDRS